MVFGNRGETSATGVAFTRDPASGEKMFYGEFLPNAQGEDVVAGIRTPRPLERRRLGHVAPGDDAAGVRRAPARARPSSRSGSATCRTSSSRSRTRSSISSRRATASARVSPPCASRPTWSTRASSTRTRPWRGSSRSSSCSSWPRSSRRRRRPPRSRTGRLLGKGLPAGPGAACGRVALTAPTAVAMAAKGETVVLVREETSPEDIAGMNAAVGILTTRGGMTSHAAVVARGMGKTCIVGAGDITVDHRPRRGPLGAPEGRSEGDWISIDGTAGEVILGQLPTQPSEVLQVLIEGTMKPEDSAVTRAFTRDPPVGRRRAGASESAPTPTRRTTPASRVSSGPRASASAGPSTCSSRRSASSRCAR